MDVIRYYESVMAAKDVIIDAIPLPNMSEGKLLLLVPVIVVIYITREANGY